MNEMMCESFTLTEIKEAVFRMGDFKALGPNGFQGVFFHTFWDIIGEEVNGLVDDFATRSEILQKLKSMQIVLIPKVVNLSSVNQFRKISLCNYTYKIFSKLLANRLKEWLLGIISPTVNAFVEGRQIQDNTLVAHEVFHFLKLRKVKTKFELAMKIDMNKAYNRIEWDFLEAVMIQMRFSGRLIRMVMGCVSTMVFSVLVN
ncbi:hypothetical protein ACFXTO_022622 [Malus domestica]